MKITQIYILISLILSIVTYSKTKPLKYRKIAVSTILHGLANTCSQAAKVVEAKDKQEKNGAICNLVSSFLQLTADATQEYEENKRKKQEKKESESNNSTQDKITTNQEQTRSISLTYFENIKNLNTRKEQIPFIKEILQNRDKTAILIDELNLKFKKILLDLLFTQ